MLNKKKIVGGGGTFFYFSYYIFLGFSVVMYKVTVHLNFFWSNCIILRNTVFRHGHNDLLYTIIGSNAHCLSVKVGLV